jgi:hypothetical protein
MEEAPRFGFIGFYVPVITTTMPFMRVLWQRVHHI